MRIRASALDVTSIVVRHVVEVIAKTKRPDHAGLAGPGSGSVLTVLAPTSPARTFLSRGTPQRRMPRFTTICHFDAPGIAYSVYVPGSTRTPAICAGNGT